MLLGIDIGGTKCAVITGIKKEANLDITGRIEVPTDLPVYEMIDHLFALGDQLLATHGISRSDLEGVGINCGGPLDSKKGLILSPPNLPGWSDVPIVQMAREHFGKNVCLQNDANAGALAEWQYGAGKGTQNMIFLTFGTGMGAGLILNGRLYSGSTDLAGEVGHLRLDRLGPVGFGKAGSFEGFCSGGGIAQLGQAAARARIQMGGTTLYCSSLEELSAVTARTIADAAFNGDETAIRVYRTCGEYLGAGLSLLIDILNPDMIVLGSIYGRAGALLEAHMNHVINQEALTTSVHHCKIVPASLGETIGDISALNLALCASGNCIP